MPRRSASAGRVAAYAKRMGDRTIFKRLGHILEVTDLLPQYESIFAGFEPSAGYPRLDPLGRHECGSSDRGIGADTNHVQRTVRRWGT